MFPETLSINCRYCGQKGVHSQTVNPEKWYHQVSEHSMIDSKRLCVSSFALADCDKLERFKGL